MGRPTKLNDETQTVVVEAIRLGMYEKDAAQAAGIGERTFHDWMARGKIGEEPFMQFSQSIKRARAEAQFANIRIIRTAAEAGKWQAAAWWLERSFPKLWGRRIEHTLITHDMVAKGLVAFEDGADRLWLDLEIARLEAEQGLPSE